MRRSPTAVQQMDRAAIRQLLDKKADVNAPQADGTTALHWAAYHDDLDLVNRLLARRRRRARGEPLRRDAAVARLHERQRRHGRAVSRRRRRRERVAARRRDDADDGRAHRQGRRGAGAACPRRRRAREGSPARTDGAHVGRGGRARRGDRRAHQSGRRFPDAARLRIHAADVRRARRDTSAPSRRC